MILVIINYFHFYLLGQIIYCIVKKDFLFNLIQHYFFGMFIIIDFFDKCYYYYCFDFLMDNIGCFFNSSCYFFNINFINSFTKNFANYFTNYFTKYFIKNFSKKNFIKNYYFSYYNLENYFNCLIIRINSILNCYLN